MESNTQAVVTPAQSLRRQWPPAYTVVVTDASPSTLALFNVYITPQAPMTFRDNGNYLTYSQGLG